MRSPRILTVTIFIFLLIGFTSAFLLNHPALAVTKVDFLGQAVLSTGFSFKGTELGGLSGISYDPNRKIYYAISDDRGNKNPARFYTLKINLSGEVLKDGGVVPVGVTTLLNENRKPFAVGRLDPEGIALNDKTVFVSSEGNAERAIAPFISEFSLSSGRQLRSLAIPQKFFPKLNPQRGIRNNAALESLTITPNKRHLFTATENALIQDGPAAAPGVGSRCRILQYNLVTNQREGEFLYPTQPITALVNIPGKFSSGLVDLLALDNQGRFLSLERSFDGLSNTILLFEVSLKGASNIQGVDSLSVTNLKTIKPVTKRLLLNFQKLQLPLDNIEGLTFGPRLPDGRQSLIFVSDNNFQSAQRTQFLAFGLETKHRRF